MCVHNITESFLIEDDLVAYKIVTKAFSFDPPSNKSDVHFPCLKQQPLLFFSRFHPNARVAQAGSSTSGVMLSYHLGEEISSDDPGLYCYFKKERALQEINVVNEEAILQVTIPKGSKIRKASSSSFIPDNGQIEFDVVLAERIIPTASIFSTPEDAAFLLS